MNHQDNDPTCPFCPFSDGDSNFVAEHVQFCHPEKGGQSEHCCMLRGAESTQEVHVSQSIDDRRRVLKQYINRSQPRDNGNATSVQTYNANTESNRPPQPRWDNHILDDLPFNEHSFVRHEPPRKDFSPDKDNVAEASSTAPSKGVKRLGRAELGPYAHEKQMPSWLRKALERGAKTTKLDKITSDGKIQAHEAAENDKTNVIPVLAELCKHDKSVQRAFFCSPEVHQISKMPREGGFCGYRNIQMLISFIRETHGPGYDRFSGGLPTILQLQNMIEQAWDMGFNTVARGETGGIRGTRKYIGTPEAQALFSSLGIQCEASSIGTTKELLAHDALLANIATYFRETCLNDKEEKITHTTLPPIYLQHHGHSLTVIGFEIRDNGKANILVFDPAYKTPSIIKNLMGTRGVAPDPARILKEYRRGVSYLQRYKTFELLRITLPRGK